MTDQMMQPHRGVLILVLGILGLVFCPIIGIFAWVMGSGDLNEMDAGRMDPEGKTLTQAGKICGIIAVVLMLLGFAFWLLVFMIGLGGAALAVVP